MEETQELDELIQGNTAEEKLSSAKDIIQSLEKEVFKLRAELKRNENTMKKLQEAASLNGQNQNNTSSAFMLPSEFKKLWEVLVMENCLDLFAPFLQSQQDFAFLTQALAKQVIKFMEKEINAKLSAVIELLGAKEASTEKVKKYLLKLFQDHYITAFPVPDTSKIGSLFIGSLSKALQTKAKPLIDTPEFESFVSTMHKLSVTMLLNDPALCIKFNETPEFVVINKPDDFYFVDGFPMGSPEGLIVLPAVFRGNYAYAGTKPAVLVLPKNFKHIENQEKEEDAEEIENVEVVKPIETVERKEADKQLTQKSADPCLKQKNSIVLSKYSDDQEPYPPLQRKKEDPSRKECLLCKIKAPCAYCSKSTLLALAKRVSSTGVSQRQYSRIQSNSLLETPGKTKNKNLTSFLSRRLSEAAKKVDKKTLIKNRQIDKEACKVM